MLYRFAQFLIRLIIPLISRIEVRGMENIPPSGAYIAVANHIGRLDAFMVYYMLDRDDIIMLVAEKYKTSAFYRLLVKATNAIFIDRYNADLNAMREVMRRLKAGGVLVMAPEGTRSPTASLQAGRDGAQLSGSQNRFDDPASGCYGHRRCSGHGPATLLQAAGYHYPSWEDLHVTRLIQR